MKTVKSIKMVAIAGCGIMAMSGMQSVSAEGTLPAQNTKLAVSVNQDEATQNALAYLDDFKRSGLKLLIQDNIRGKVSDKIYVKEYSISVSGNKIDFSNAVIFRSSHNDFMVTTGNGSWTIDSLSFTNVTLSIVSAKDLIAILSGDNSKITNQLQGISIILPRESSAKGKLTTKP